MLYFRKRATRAELGDMDKTKRRRGNGVSYFMWEIARTFFFLSFRKLKASESRYVLKACA